MANEETFRTRVEPVLVTLPDGCRLAARAFGPEDAPPVLLVAGGDGTMLQWRGLVPELCVDEAERALFAEAGCVDSLAADLRVAVFDARGSGWSSRSHGVCASTGAAGADALALAAALFRTPFHLVGHGLGAAVALQVALASGRLVRSLTLISGLAGGDLLVSPDDGFFETRIALAEALRRAGAPLRDVGWREELAALVRRDVEAQFSAAFVAAHPRLVGHLAAEALHDLLAEIELARHGFTGMTAADGRGEQFSTLDLGPRLADLATPTLVVAAGEDAVVPPGNAEVLAARIPGARLASVEAGYFSTIERAGEVAAMVRAHVLLHP